MSPGAGKRDLAISEGAWLAKIATLYYRESLPLREIAQKMGVSVATISRSLSAARDGGIVEIHIKGPSDERLKSELAIEQGFGLNECIIVPSSSDSADVCRLMAQGLGKLLARVTHPGLLLGVSWGRTLNAMGENLIQNTALAVDVVPILGAMGIVETGIFPNAIARAYAERLGGRTYLVNTPFLCDSETSRVAIERESSFRHVKQLWGRLGAVLVSVSGLDNEASILGYGILRHDDLVPFRNRGVIGATNFTMFDANGQEIVDTLSGRMVRLPYRTMMRVPVRILAAFGKEKVSAIAAALRGHVATVLITDESTAVSILEISRVPGEERGS